MFDTHAPYLGAPAGQSVTETQNAVIDFVFKCQKVWIEAIAADFYKFWLEPYFYASTKKRPPGYYYRLARVKPR